MTMRSTVPPIVFCLSAVYRAFASAIERAGHGASGNALDQMPVRPGSPREESSQPRARTASLWKSRPQRPRCVFRHRKKARV
jgi:hypothetical protein